MATQQPVYSELLFILRRVTGMARGNDIFTGIGYGQHGGWRFRRRFLMVWRRRAEWSCGRRIRFRGTPVGVRLLELSRPCELQQVRLVIDFDLTGSVDHYPPSFYPARERATD